MSGSASKEDPKIEDILKSIRGIIDNKDLANSNDNHSSPDYDDEDNDEILELTAYIDISDDDDYINVKTKKKTKAQINKFSTALKNGNYDKGNQSVEAIITDLVKPLIKNWLNNNLPKIVEKIVSEEIKKITPR